MTLEDLERDERWKQTLEFQRLLQTWKQEDRDYAAETNRIKENHTKTLNSYNRVSRILMTILAVNIFVQIALFITHHIIGECK